MVGSRKQSTHDELLVVDLVVRRDNTTGCRLSFGSRVKFDEGEAAVRVAMRALEAQLQDGKNCPANTTKCGVHSAQEPRYALFGGVNRRSPGEEPCVSQFITAHATVWEAQDRAAFGNFCGTGLRWYAVVDRESGDVVASEEW